MRISIGIVRETKSIWEKRTPLIPADIKKLIAKYPIDIFVQPSEKRIYSNDEYIEAGAIVQEDLSNCSILVGIKEVKTKNLLPDKTYTFFSHTIKGQDYNMKMLQKIIDSGITLVDYEKIEDKNGKRLIFFSVQAGLAGIIDSLWSLGQRYECEGINTPFSSLRQAYHYDSLEEAKNALLEAGDKIKSGEFPQELAPLTIGISGYGNVSSGVQQLLDLLPVKEISPAELISLKESGEYSKLLVYKIVFKEKDMVQPISEADIFNLQDYYDNPTKYKSIFENYLPYLTVFINATYWDSKYPRFVTNQYLKTLYSQEKVKLKSKMK